MTLFLPQLFHTGGQRFVVPSEFRYGKRKITPIARRTHFCSRQFAVDMKFHLSYCLKVSSFLEIPKPGPFGGCISRIGAQKNDSRSCLKECCLSRSTSIAMKARVPVLSCTPEAFPRPSSMARSRSIKKAMTCFWDPH